jgi:hypothetical protein
VKPSERHLICGTTDTGKSFLVKAELRKLARDHRVHILDCHAEYARDLAKVVRRLEAKDLAHRLPELLERQAVAIVPSRKSVGAYAATFRMLYRTYMSKRWAAAYEREPITTVLVLDEVHLYNANVAQELEALATTGKHQGIALKLIAQRVKAIHPDVRSQCQRVVAFAQEEDLDFEALERRCGEEFVEGVRRLPPHEYLEWRGKSLSAGPEQERSNEASS